MGFKRHNTGRRLERGIGILEMAMMILVLGMTSVVALALYDRYSEFQKTEENKARVERVQAALDSFVDQNGRLPAPALMTDRPDTGTYGTETAVTAVVTSANSTATIPGTKVATNGRDPDGGGLLGNRIVRIGTVPVRSLNLPDEYMLDAWGNRMVYAVTQDYIIPTPVGAVSPFSQDLGGISIRDSRNDGATSSTSVDGTAIYSIVASGSDGRGAYSASGVAGEPCAGPAYVMENCFDQVPTDAVFINTLSNKGDATTAQGFAHNVQYMPGKDKFRWERELSACTAVCGTGTQTVSYNCVNSVEILSPGRCLMAPPNDNLTNVNCTRTCSWSCGDWTCNSLCGPGTETRSCTCQNSAGLPLTDADCIAAGFPKPSVSQACNPSTTCTYSWRTDVWGACLDGAGAPVTCGNGTQTRNVWCVRDIDNVAVLDAFCNAATRPPSSQACTMAACVCPAAPAVCPPGTMYNDAGGNPVCPCPAVCPANEPANCPDGTFYNDTAGNPVCPCRPSVCGAQPQVCPINTFYADSKGVLRCPCTGGCPPSTCSGDNCPVVGVCFLETTNWADPATYGVAGGTKSASRTCTPPAGYNITATKMYANLDDGGTVSVGGTTLFNDPWNDCAVGVFSPQIIPNLPAAGSTLDIQARNCGLAGVGGWAYIGFYGEACGTPTPGCVPGPYKNFASTGETYPDMVDGQFIDAAEQSSIGIQPGNFNVAGGDEVELTYTGGTTPFRSYVYIYTIAADNSITILNKPLEADPANPNRTITIKIEQPASMAAFISPAVKMGLLLLPNRLNAGTINGRLDGYYNHMQSGQRTARIGDTVGNLSLVYTPNSGNFGYEPAALLTHERGGPIMHAFGLASMVSAPLPGDATRLRVSFEDFPGGAGYAGSDGDANDVQLQVRIRPLAPASVACPQYYWGNLTWGMCTTSTGSINSCGDGNRNRAIGCVKDEGAGITAANIVNQSFCVPETRPRSTEPCKISNMNCGPSCSDGIQNQDETGIDTGGVCGSPCSCGAAPACGVTYNDSCNRPVCYERCIDPICTCDPGAATGTCGGLYNDSCGNPTCPNPNRPTCGEPPACGIGRYADSCGNNVCDAPGCGGNPPNEQWTWGIQCNLSCGGNCVGVGTPDNVNQICARTDAAGVVTQWNFQQAASVPECNTPAMLAEHQAKFMDCTSVEGPAYGLTGACCP